MKTLIRERWRRLSLQMRNNGDARSGSTSSDIRITTKLFSSSSQTIQSADSAKPLSAPGGVVSEAPALKGATVVLVGTASAGPTSPTPLGTLVARGALVARRVAEAHGLAAETVLPRPEYGED